MPESVQFKSAKSQAFALISLETLIILLIAVAISLFRGWTQAYSYFLGGMVSILPNFYFACKVFRENKASAAKRIVKTFYRSEFIKLTFMAILFTIFMKLVKLDLWLFILGFLTGQMGIWFAPLLFFKEYRVKN